MGKYDRDRKESYSRPPSKFSSSGGRDFRSSYNSRSFESRNGRESFKENRSYLGQKSSHSFKSSNGFKSSYGGGFKSEKKFEYRKFPAKSFSDFRPKKFEGGSRDFKKPYHKPTFSKSNNYSDRKWDNKPRDYKHNRSDHKSKTYEIAPRRPVSKQMADNSDCIQRRTMASSLKLLHGSPTSITAFKFLSDIVPNLSVFKQQTSQIKLVSKLNSGWLCLISPTEITFLSQNMITYGTYEASDVLSTLEYSATSDPNSTIDTIFVLIKARSLEILTCYRSNYLDMTWKYTVDFKSFSLFKVQPFPKTHELLFVRPELKQRYQILDLHDYRILKHKETYLEQGERTGQIAGNDIRELSYNDKILQIQTEKDVIYLYQREVLDKNPTALSLRYLQKFSMNIQVERLGISVKIEQFELIAQKHVVILSKDFIYLFNLEGRRFVFNGRRSYPLYSFTLETEQPVAQNRRRLIWDPEFEYIIISEGNDIYYSKLKQFMEGTVNQDNVGFACSNPNAVTLLKGLKTARLIFAEEERLVNWNL